MKHLDSFEKVWAQLSTTDASAVLFPQEAEQWTQMGETAQKTNIGANMHRAAALL